MTFTLRRRKFPVKLAFACTLSKSQVQTYNHVRLLLDSTVFSHDRDYDGFFMSTLNA